MKKSLSIVSVLMVAVFSVLFLSSCGGNSSKYYLPNITTDIEGWTIEHVTNRSGDVILPIEDESLRKADYDNWGSIAWAWLIKKDDNLVGWIKTDGGYDTNGKNEVYGFIADKKGGKNLSFSAQVLSITFVNKDISVFDNVDILTNYGYISKGEASKHSQDNEYVVCPFILHLEDENPNDISSIDITIRVNQF